MLRNSCVYNAESGPARYCFSASSTYTAECQDSGEQGVENETTGETHSLSQLYFIHSYIFIFLHSLMLLYSHTFTISLLIGHLKRERAKKCWCP